MFQKEMSSNDGSKHMAGAYCGIYHLGASRRDNCRHEISQDALLETTIASASAARWATYRARSTATVFIDTNASGNWPQLVRLFIEHPPSKAASAAAG
jgi:hypothetical protein